ncbi:MAG TPA: hypothetical protein VGB97_02045 [Candidatus Paceibacterota bacterium]|jgi:hypothetical protein
MLIFEFGVVVATGLYILFSYFSMLFFFVRRLNLPWKAKWVDGTFYLTAHLGIATFVTLTLCMLFVRFHGQERLYPQFTICCFQAGVSAWLVTSVQQKYRETFG